MCERNLSLYDYVVVFAGHTYPRLQNPKVNALFIDVRFFWSVVYTAAYDILLYKTSLAGIILYSCIHAAGYSLEVYTQTILLPMGGQLSLTISRLQHNGFQYQFKYKLHTTNKQ